MSRDRLTFIILTTVVLAVYSVSFVAGRSTGIAIGSINGTRKMEEKKSPSVKVNDANSEVTVHRFKVSDLPVERRTQESAVTDFMINTEKPSTVRRREKREKNRTKGKTGRTKGGENDDNIPLSSTPSIIGAPCPADLRRDNNGACRQSID